MARPKHVMLFLYLYTIGISCIQAAYYDDEESLRTAVLTNYQYKIRPNGTVDVTVKLSLLNINVLDVPSQRLSVSGWLTLEWNDPRLVWTPSSYGDIDDLYDTELVLWRPEIIVDNSVSDLGILESDKLLIRAMYDGNMTWEPPGIYETHCDVDVTFYPFDTQTCVVEVTSWSYTVEELDLEAYEAQVDLADFQESGEWDILNSWSERKELVDGSEIRAEVSFSIKLRRKPSYYVTTILIPVIVTSILCVVVFGLPAESGEKVGYSLTILLTYTVMLTLVASYMPPTSKHTSVLSVYLTIILFIGVFSTFLTVIVLVFHHRPDYEPVPDWLLKLTINVMIPFTRWKGHLHEENNKGSAGQTDASVPSKQQDNKVHRASGFRHPEVTVGLGGKRNSNGEAERNKKDRKMTVAAIQKHEFTWPEVSMILDAFCLRFWGIFVFLLTMIVLLVLIIGGYAV